MESSAARVGHSNNNGEGGAFGYGMLWCFTLHLVSVCIAMEVVGYAYFKVYVDRHFCEE